MTLYRQIRTHRLAGYPHALYLMPGHRPKETSRHASNGRLTSQSRRRQHWPHATTASSTETTRPSAAAKMTRSMPPLILTITTRTRTMRQKKRSAEENRPPKRNHTTQQSIQARSVGYRIQAFSDNTASAKALAQQRARNIAMKFPQYRSYISYNAPSWRLRIGDFKSQDDAQKALQRVRAAFPAYGREMIIVRDRINVWGN